MYPVGSQSSSVRKIIWIPGNGFKNEKPNVFDAISKPFLFDKKRPAGFPVGSSFHQSFSTRDRSAAVSVPLLGERGQLIQLRHEPGLARRKRHILGRWHVSDERLRIAKALGDRGDGSLDNLLDVGRRLKSSDTGDGSRGQTGFVFPGSSSGKFPVRMKLYRFKIRKVERNFRKTVKIVKKKVFHHFCQIFNKFPGSSKRKKRWGQEWLRGMDDHWEIKGRIDSDSLCNDRQQIDEISKHLEW